MSNFASPLTDDECAALETVCRRRKVGALVWKRARAFLPLDGGRNRRHNLPNTGYRPDSADGVAVCASATGLAFFGLNAYSQREGPLSLAREEALKQHFTEHPPRIVHEIRAHILAAYDQSYSASGTARPMRRLGFAYNKPIALCAQAGPERQRTVIDWYEALMCSLPADGTVLFSDAVHSECQSRAAHGWFPKGQRTAVKTTLRHRRLNIQGALDLETFPFTFVQGEKTNAETTQQIPERIERNYPTQTAIHVILNNARYHHAKALNPGLKARRGG